MPFIKEIERFNSLSIVGMAKNTGKTTCLNYVMRRLQEEGINLAVTSIGVDGEERDVLYDTPKPRITLSEQMVFVTAEEDFAKREFPAEVLDTSERSTPLGRLVTARAKGCGKVVLSGPSDSKWLHEVICSMEKYGVRLTLVDGALSRMSLASPAVTDSMILCTGAACSAQLSQLIHITKFRCNLINLEKVDTTLYNQLINLENNVWQWREDSNTWERIGESLFTLDNGSVERLHMIYVGGAVTNDFLKLLGSRKSTAMQLIVRDFTKLFVEPAVYDKFIRRGGTIKVLQKAKLLAVCTNPLSPEGARLHPIMLREQMQEALQLPVYDIMEIEGVNILKDGE